MLLQQICNGLINGSFYALMAIGLTIIFGLMEIINFAHGEFYMLGAFASLFFVTSLELHWLWAVVLSCIFTFIFGYACEKMIIRPLREASPLNKALAMIGLSFFLKNLVIAVVGAKPKDIPFPLEGKSINIGSVSFSLEQACFVLTTFFMFFMLYLLLYKFKIGKSMRATFQNKESAALMGVNINGVYSLTFGLGCMLVGVAGSLLGTLYLVYPAMGDLAIVKSFIVAILGGLGSIPGAICGGFILGVTESLGAGYISSEYKDVFGFIIVIILLLVRPKGMFGK
jgi:branched-chain amino acid transport system permease protein